MYLKCQVIEEMQHQIHQPGTYQVDLLLWPNTITHPGLKVGVYVFVLPTS